MIDDNILKGFGYYDRDEYDFLGLAIQVNDKKFSRGYRICTSKFKGKANFAGNEKIVYGKIIDAINETINKIIEDENFGKEV